MIDNLVAFVPDIPWKGLPDWQEQYNQPVNLTPFQRGKKRLQLPGNEHECHHLFRIYHFQGLLRNQILQKRNLIVVNHCWLGQEELTDPGNELGHDPLSGNVALTGPGNELSLTHFQEMLP